MHGKVKVHFLFAHHLDVGHNHVEVVELHDFAEATFQQGLAVGIARIQAHFAANHLFIGLGVAMDMHLVNLGRQTFSHLVGQVHNRIVFEGSGFFVLGKQVAVFTVGIQESLARSVILILVKDFTTIETVSVSKHLVVQHLVTREVQATHVVTTAFDHVNMNQNSARSLDVIVLVQGREHVFDHVADHQLFLISRALFNLAERIDLGILPLTAIHNVQEFLASIFVADNVVQHLPGVFFDLDRDLRSRHPRHFAHFSMLAEEVRHLHGGLARHLVKRRCRVAQGKVQLLV